MNRCRTAIPALGKETLRIAATRARKEMLRNDRYPLSCLRAGSAVPRARVAKSRRCMMTLHQHVSCPERGGSGEYAQSVGSDGTWRAGARRSAECDSDRAPGTVSRGVAIRRPVHAALLGADWLTPMTVGLVSCDLWGMRADNWSVSHDVDTHSPGREQHQP